MAFRDQSDEALVHRVRSGEREVFGVLVDRYKRGIANFIGATVRNSAETADLSQETFLRAYAHLNTFNPQLGKFSTWIYQIARNVIRTYLAKSQRAPQLQELSQEQTLETALADPSPQADPAGAQLALGFLAQQAAGGIRLRRWIGKGRLERLLLRKLLQLRDALRFGQIGANHVARDLIDPGRELPELRVESIQMRVGAQERFL